jgi:hypothetical protein
MADEEAKTEHEIDLERTEDERRLEFMMNDSMDPILKMMRVYQIWWHWADFSLSITEPEIEPIVPPLIIQPEILEDGTHEFVYPIIDHGNRLETSKAEDMFSAGMSMCRLYYTIEKMIHLLVERLKSGGIDMQTEVQVAFGGHELAQRKAFESVINLSYNVVVTNFDPAEWGERYLQNVKRVADKGYGYPSETPRDSYRQHSSPTTKIKF